MASYKSVMKRVGQVVKVFSKHGLGFLVDELRLRVHLPFFYKIQKHRVIERNNLPKRMRMALEELGGIYIKLGQLLALRPDLVPVPYCHEFRKLQDHVKPIPFNTIKKIVETELREPIEKVFSSFSKEPIGSASVAQVHIAVLQNNEKVVVKVQRPNIKELFDADLESMYFLAKKLERRKDLYEFSPIKIVEEVERYTKNELDFSFEGRNIAHFYKLFADSKAVKIPKYYRTLSSKKVLTMSYLEGIKLSDLKKGFNRFTVANNIFELAIRQVFESDIFHADLHPGNILVLKNGKIGLLDFGITGWLSEHLREQGVRLYLSIIDKDAEEAYNALIHMAHYTKESDLDGFKEEVAELIDQWNPYSGIRVTHLLHKLLNASVKYDVHMSNDVVLLGKALVTAEGTCLYLNPDFDFVEKSKPFIKEIFTTHWKDKANLKNFIKKSYDLSDILMDIPRKTLSALQTIEKGTIKVDIADEDLRDLSRKIDISGDRISTALVSASFIVAGALVSQIDVGPKYFGLPVIATVSFGIAFLMVIFLLMSFLKREKTFISRR